MNYRSADLQIRHFRTFIREKGEQHTARRRTCFAIDGNNERVQIGLELVLKYFKEYYRNPGVFAELADAAYILVPPL
jgi:hypothetical protein